MRSSWFWLAVGTAACTTTLPPTGPPATLAVEAEATGDYIVSLSPGVNPRALAANANVAPRYVYSHALIGFSATLSAAAVDAFRRNPQVRYVSPVTIVSTQTVASWGLDRVDQRTLPLSGTFAPPNHGAGVRVYILDTGIRYTHPELVGRVAQGIDVIGGDFNADDCHGHGTHVAGTVGGLTVGIANQATLVAVRMLGCDGSATSDQAIAAIDWVVANRILPAAANMSWGGSTDTPLMEAVQAMVQSGVTSAAAAGNSNADACGFSPANTPDVLSVAASDASDLRATFSNFGTCVDLFAPGVGIYSSLITGGYGTKSGTSMASPHVAGIAALYLAANPLATPGTVMQAILAGATQNAITNPTGSPNRLAYSQIAGAGVLPPLPPPPLPELVGTVWIDDLDDASIREQGYWWANARVHVVASTGGPVEAAVEAALYDGDRYDETLTCLTDLANSCLLRGTLKNGVRIATIRIQSVTPRDGGTYDPTKNTDPDGDSNGSSIVVRKP